MASSSSSVPSPAPNVPAANVAVQALLEVDSREDDSGYEDHVANSGYGSETTSLGSSVFNYEYENGRRYHAFRAGQYAIPNDETEQNRLDMMHHIYSLLLGGKLHDAPLKEPKRILDIGTGTGIWAIDIADTYRDAEVVGTDLSPIQPGWVPSNVQFFIDDAESEWTFQQKFDYIHVRGLAGSIQDWPRLIAQAYKALNPGGYLEILEAPRFDLVSDDGTYNDKTALWRFYELANKASDKTGRSLSLNHDFEKEFKEAGFEDYRVTIKNLPLGTWPANRKMKELGQWMQLMVNTGFEAYGLGLLTRVLGMDVEEARKLFADCAQEVQKRSVHGYYPMHIMFGRKA